jgi:hemerythrin-like domain-containing protein
MLETDAKTLTQLIEALKAQAQAGHSLTKAQRKALVKFANMYADSVHHHHDNEERIAFPYMQDVKKGTLPERVTTDHASLLRQIQGLGMQAKAIEASTSAAEDASKLESMLAMFRQLEVEMLEHFNEEETVVLPLLRKWVQNTFHQYTRSLPNTT